jgi:hypothetical protein
VSLEQQHSGLSVFMPTTTQPNAFDASEEYFLRQLEDLRRQQKECEDMIKRLREAKKRIMGGVAEIPPVKPGEYVSMRPVDALEHYLKARRGLRIPLNRAVSDLVAGGVDAGQPRGKKNDPAALVTHTLKISLPNRKDTFGWSPEHINPKGRHVIAWLSLSTMASATFRLSSCCAVSFTLLVRIISQSRFGQSHWCSPGCGRSEKFLQTIFSDGSRLSRLLQCCITRAAKLTSERSPANGENSSMPCSM